MSGILSGWLRWAGRRQGAGRTLHCTVPRPRSGPPQSRTGLSVPLHQAVSPRALHLSFTSSFLPSAFAHAVPVPSPLHAVLQGTLGAVLPREGALCCCSSSVMARTWFLERPWALFLGRGLCPVLSLESWEACGSDSS